MCSRTADIGGLNPNCSAARRDGSALVRESWLWTLHEAFLGPACIQWTVYAVVKMLDTFSYHLLLLGLLWVVLVAALLACYCSSSNAMKCPHNEWNIAAWPCCSLIREYGPHETPHSAVEERKPLLQCICALENVHVVLSKPNLLNLSSDANM